MCCWLVLIVLQKMAYRPAMPVDNLTPAAPPVQIIASMPLRRMTSKGLPRTLRRKTIRRWSRGSPSILRAPPPVARRLKSRTRLDCNAPQAPDRHPTILLHTDKNPKPLKLRALLGSPSETADSEEPQGVRPDRDSKNAHPIDLRSRDRAHEKTLEQKIAEQGPVAQRVDPHLVSLAIEDLIALGPSQSTPTSQPGSSRGMRI
jgi:hypothetical protein